MNDETGRDAGLLIRVLDDDDEGRLADRRLAAGSDGVYAFDLKCLEGADAVHFAVTDDHDRIFRCEIPAHPERPVHVELSPDGSGGWTVASDNNHVLLMSGEAEPLPVIPRPPGSAKARVTTADGWFEDRGTIPDSSTRWEVAFVIDATARAWPKSKLSGSERGRPEAKPSGSEGNRPESVPFLTDSENKSWSGLCRELDQLLAALGQKTDSRWFTVIAFGDREIDGITAKELFPSYLLRVPAPGRELRMVSPSEGRLEFRAFRPDAAEPLPETLEPSPDGDFVDALGVAERLLATIEPSPGGDFVDALGDALAACNRLPWSSEARKLVVVLGDSPGHSIAHPIGYCGDAAVRVRDVDLEVQALHRKGVELVTIFNRPSADYVGYDRHSRALLQRAARQYRRLASTPKYALDAADFKHTNVAKLLNDRNEAIGRNASYARLLSPRSNGNG